MNKVETSKNKFFQKHWTISIIFTWILILVISEFILRIIDPDIFKYVYNGRQVFKYSTQWRVDLVPSSTAHLNLKTYDNQNLFNFIVTTSEFGFRTYDREVDTNYDYSEKQKENNSAANHFIHAIGDSFTFGWGVDYTSSYPSILDWMLPTDYRVLNLGVAGFGSISATEKSLLLWNNYPADHVFYLFCSYNDFSDDDLVMKRRRPSYKIYHTFRNVYSFICKYSYIANIPYIVKTYRENLWARRGNIRAKGKSVSKDDINKINVTFNTPIAVTKYKNDRPTFAQISKYVDFLRKHNVGLTVLLMDNRPESMEMYSFCIAKGIDVYVLSITDEMRLLRDGHLNYAGNYFVAKFLRDRVLNNAFFSRYNIINLPGSVD